MSTATCCAAGQADCIVRNGEHDSPLIIFLSAHEGETWSIPAHTPKGVRFQSEEWPQR